MSSRWRIAFGLALGLVLLGLAPLLSAFTAMVIADLNDCTLHEGFENPCVVFGVDLGETLYTMLVVVWLGIVTLPLAILGVVVVAALTVAWLVSRRRGRTATPDA